MAFTNTETVEDENFDKESDSLLKKKTLKDDRKENEDKLRKMSIRGHYFTLFVNALATTIVYSSLWSYLKQMDVETTTWYLGLVHAAFNGGELCCIVLYGLWVQYRPGVEPLTFSLIALIVGNALYAWSLTFGYYGKFAVLVSRSFIGCATGNDVIVTVLLCEQTCLRDRTSVMVNCALSQAVGFIAGPVIQSCFVLLGKHGIYAKGLALHINMYTMAGIFCVFLGIVNLATVWMYGRYEFQVIEVDTDDDAEHGDNSVKRKESSNGNGNGNGNGYGNGNGNGKELPDLIAVLSVLTLFYFMRHILVFIEVMFSPMAMDFYALSDSDTLLYIGLILAIAGICSIFIFVGTDKLASWAGDRVPLLISAVLGFLGFAVLWPLSKTYPKLGHFYTVAVNTTEGIDYVEKVTLGCSPKHSWCKTTPIITLAQVGVSLAFLIISYPIAYTILPSIFTKIIKPGRQGFMVSLLSIAGNLSRILGPTMFTAVYTYYGPRPLIAMMDVGLFVSLLLTITFYKRLIPYKDYIRIKKKNQMDAK